MGVIGLYLVLIRVILERLNNSFGTVCASIFDEPWEWLPATIIAARCRSHSKKGENHFVNLTQQYEFIWKKLFQTQLIWSAAGPFPKAGSL
jgi:hypothetical protein